MKQPTGQKEVVTMTKNTMTQTIALSTAISVLSADEQYSAVVEKLSAMLNTLENKRSTPSKAQTAKTAEHESICAEILAILTAENRMMTITEIQHKSEKLTDFSNQKMSAMLKKLTDCGKVNKTIDKKKVYFSVTAE